MRHRILTVLAFGLAVSLALILRTPVDANLSNVGQPSPFAAPKATSTDLSGSCPGGVGNPSDLITAINKANADSTADTITLAAGCVYTLTSASAASIGLPQVTTPLTIAGNGSTITRDSGTAFRIFYVASAGDLTLDSLTVSGGQADVGGGILAYGSLTLQNVTVTANTSTINATGQGGGGVMLDGGQASISDSVFQENQGIRGGGLAVVSGGIVTITASSFFSNTGVGTGDTYGGGCITIPGLLQPCTTAHSLGIL